MTTLRVVLTELRASPDSAEARYAIEITSALIRTAPDGCDVEGIIASDTGHVRERIHDLLPTIGALRQIPLSLASVRAAWSIGVTAFTGAGMLHAPSLFAPLRRYDRLNNAGRQLSVTIADTRPWRAEGTLPAGRARYLRRQGSRAWRFADAIVVPTHAVAIDLEELLGVNERIRVIGNGPSAAAIALAGNRSAPESELPAGYLLIPGGHLDQAWRASVLGALLQRTGGDVPVVITGLDESAAESLRSELATGGVDHSALIIPAPMTERERAQTIRGASALVHADLHDGSGQVLIDALTLGVPIVHVATPALMEVVDEACVAVDTDADELPELLADEAIRVLGDDTLRDTLRLTESDRLRNFGWDYAAAMLWQLHADL